MSSSSRSDKALGESMFARGDTDSINIDLKHIGLIQDPDDGADAEMEKAVEEKSESQANSVEVETPPKQATARSMLWLPL